MTDWPSVPMRRVTSLAYGDSLSADVRQPGDVEVFGSNGAVGVHDRSNTRSPAVIVGRKGSFGKVHYSPRPVFAIDTTYFVDESRTTANLRWLYYALSSLGLDGLSEDVGVPGLSREKAYEQRLLYPPPATQQAIADYLDRETARIDALIAAKWRMVELLFKRYWSWVGRQIDQCAPTYLPLRRFLTRITDGPFGSALTSNDYSSGGARVVRLGNIGSGFFRDDDAAYISTEYFQSLSRHRVSSGDLLIAGLGDANNAVGRACVAPELGPAIVKADCYCASVNVNRASADFLALYLSSPLGAKNVAVAARGTTRSRINLDIALEVEVPLLPLAVQDEITLAATALRERGRELSQRLQLQLGLLEERRRSLITAAITGQLDIPEAA